MVLPRRRGLESCAEYSRGITTTTTDTRIGNGEILDLIHRDKMPSEEPARTPRRQRIAQGIPRHQSGAERTVACVASMRFLEVPPEMKLPVKIVHLDHWHQVAVARIYDTCWSPPLPRPRSPFQDIKFCSLSNGQ